MPTEKKKKKPTKHNLSLSDKLQQHWKTRKFDPSERSLNIFGICVVWTNTFALALEGFVLLLPHFFSDNHGGNFSQSIHNKDDQFSWGLFLCEAATVYLLVGTGAQWVFLRDGRPDTVDKNKIKELCRKDTVPESWKYCTTCRLSAPPRSHHCRVCEHCVLKRDHHCYFSGSCVGYHNQRHFVIFLMYALVASAYGVFMLAAYLFKEERLFYFFPPITIWRTVTRQSSVLHLILLLHFWLSVVITCACVSFIAWQIRVILRGQTSYEAVTRSTKYCYSAGGGRTVAVEKRKGINTCRYENFVDACGTPLEFLVCVFIPVVRTKLKGDGINWTA